MENYQKISIRVGFIIIFAFGAFITKAQSNFIKNVFRLLPSSYIFRLTEVTRDSILEGKTYYPIENDSNSVLAFNYGASNFVDDYMYISMAYETSQHGAGMVEIRGFKMKEKDIIIVSKTGGVENINYEQIDISAFIYDGDKKLSLYKDTIFPEWPEDLFIKSGVPDSIKKVILGNLNLIYDFSNPDVALLLKSPFLYDNSIYREWLKGNCIKYAWTGKQFIPGSAYFSD